MDTPSKTYKYLSNWFLSNRTLLDQMIKTLLKKKMAFPKMIRKLNSCNKRKFCHFLTRKICGYEIVIKWNKIDWMVDVFPMITTNSDKRNINNSFIIDKHT